MRTPTKWPNPRRRVNSDDERGNIDVFLRQKGNALLGTKDIPRLMVRQRDAEFFRKCIQQGDAGGVLEEADTDLCCSRIL
jgi:hypothetical protein